MPAEPAKFAALFNKPTVEEMHALSPGDFEHFVAYALRRAGYEVKEVGPHWLRGVDLEMRVPGMTGIFGGVECKKYAPGNLVKANVVKGVLGAAAVSESSTKPFVITTSDFNSAAYQVAEAGVKRAYLVNGAQLVRFIIYVQRSLYDGTDAITSLSPEFFAGPIQPRPVYKTKVLTIANNKGGVGKTTTAYYLGAEIARLGNRVLLIDLDGQANLTERCFPEPDVAPDAQSDNGLERFPNIAQYFSGQRSLRDLVKGTDTERVSIIPADMFLTLRDLGGSGRPDIELRFASDVQELCMQPLPSLGGTPDWIIIDTPPAMSAFSRAGLAAAQYVLAPIRARKASAPGTVNMLRTLRTMNALTGSAATYLGTVITHWDGLKLSEYNRDVWIPARLREFGGGSFQTMIPMDNQLDTLEPGARTPGAKAYAALAEEVMRHVNTRG